MSQSSETVTPLMPVSIAGERRFARPTARQWMLHAALFLVTAGTTTICGIMMAGPDINHGPETGGGAGFIGTLFMIPRYYLSAIWGLLSYSFAHPYFLGQGLIFSGSLLAILTAHESGHYLFCRHYGVDATLPFFIPQPPLLIPGTFGAFIKMKSPVPSSRALCDIGLAGPLAGLVMFLYVVLLAVMLRVHHPQPEQMEPLGLARTIIGVITLTVFALCFLPFPITIG